MEVNGDDRSVVEAVERAYGFNAVSAERVGSAEDRLIVKIVDGWGQQFVLKNRPRWTEALDFVLALDLQEQAMRCGARIPAVVRTADGRLSWRWEGLDLALHTWVEGAAMQWSAQHAHALGIAVGSFSTSVAAMENSQVGNWMFPAGRDRWLPDTPHQLRSVGKFMSDLGLPGDSRAAIDGILENAARVAARHNLRAGFIHGDVSPHNAVWTVDRAALIDFDEIRWGFRLFDAVQGVATVGGLDPGPAGPTVRTTWASDRAQAFLAGWAPEARPTPAEVAVFSAYLKLALVRVVVGELDLDDPHLPTRLDAQSSIENLIQLLESPTPSLGLAST